SMLMLPSTITRGRLPVAIPTAAFRVPGHHPQCLQVSNPALKSCCQRLLSKAAREQTILCPLTAKKRPAVAPASRFLRTTLYVQGLPYWALRTCSRAQGPGALRPDAGRRSRVAHRLTRRRRAGALPHHQRRRKRLVRKGRDFFAPGPRG